MPFEQRFRQLLERRGGAVDQWPLGWRLLWRLVLRYRADCVGWVDQANREARQLQQMMTALPTLAVSDGLQARLMAISARPRPLPLPVSASRSISPWGVGMSTALASVMLGFLLGAGGVVAPLDSPDGFEIDSDASYEVSAWLVEESE